MAAWDLLLDPQMIDAGYWRWTPETPVMPGIPDIPARNFVAWFAIGVVMVAVLDRLPGPGGDRVTRVDDRLPIALYLWAYASSVLAHLAFFGRPAVAVVGGLGMGVVALPLLLRSRLGRTA